jgi:hypothetical protein
MFFPADWRFLLMVVRYNTIGLKIEQAITVVERSEIRTVFAPAHTLRTWVRIPLEAWMFVCIVLCLGRGLASRWSSIQGVESTVYVIKTCETTKAQQLAAEQW